MSDRRQENMLKSVVLPVVVAIITGAASSYMATKITLSVVETKVNYIETDMVSIKDLLGDVTKNQLEIARREGWMGTVENRLGTIETHLSNIENKTQDRYTRSEAEKDHALINQRINQFTPGVFAPRLSD